MSAAHACFSSTFVGTVPHYAMEKKDPFNMGYVFELMNLCLATYVWGYTGITNSP
jgi:hypothetical protein